MYRVTPRAAAPFRVPTERTWSKQHPRIRTPRPLVDRFNLGRMHPNKEWWRERRVAPATFMGFPDVTKAELRGGSLYTEQMDAATLAVIVDKCVSEKIFASEFWEKFSWRTQQIINTVSSTEVAYLFRGFSRANGFWDSHLVLSLWGRIDFLLGTLEMADLGVVLQGFHNPKYRAEKYEKRVLSQVDLLLSLRAGEWTVAELTRVANNVLYGGNNELLQRDIAKKALDQLASSADLCDLSVAQIGGLLASMASLGSAHPELFFALTRELKEPARCTRTGDEAAKLLRAVVHLNMHPVEPVLVAQLTADWYDQIHALSDEFLLESLDLGSALNAPPDWKDIVLRRINRQQVSANSIS